MSEISAAPNNKVALQIISILLIFVSAFELIILIIVLLNGIENFVYNPIFVISQCGCAVLIALIVRSTYIQYRRYKSITDDNDMDGWGDPDRCPECNSKLEIKEFDVSKELMNKIGNSVIDVWECAICPKCDKVINRRLKLTEENTNKRTENY